MENGSTQFKDSRKPYLCISQGISLPLSFKEWQVKRGLSKVSSVQKSHLVTIPTVCLDTKRVSFKPDSGSLPELSKRQVQCFVDSIKAVVRDVLVHVVNALSSIYDLENTI